GVEEVLVGCGFSEAYNWSLVPQDDDPNAIRLPEPLSAEQAVLRTTLRRGVVESAQRNVDAGADDVALFEIARVHLPSGDELREMRPFDVYRGEQVGPGTKSVAFAVTFQSDEKTLTDEEAGELRNRIVTALQDRFGAQLRA